MIVSLCSDRLRTPGPDSPVKLTLKYYSSHPSAISSATNNKNRTGLFSNLKSPLTSYPSIVQASQPESKSIHPVKSIDRMMLNGLFDAETRA